MRGSRPLAVFLLLAAALVLGACGLLPGLSGEQGKPTPLPVSSPTPLPAAEVTFVALPPAGTPSDAELVLSVLDEVTGLPYNTISYPMQRLQDGRWLVRLTVPVGSLLHYRYARRSPGSAEEADALGEAVRFRVVNVSGPLEVQDIIAGWTDLPYQGPTGRVLGRLQDTQTGQPLSEMMVSIGGRLAFSDGEGDFRVDGLAPGLHILTAFSTDGRYRPVQQGAVIAADSTTPAALAMQAAPLVQVTFEVTVPGDTVPGTPVRMAGNLRQLGAVFGELPGGVWNASSRMPTLTMVDDTHYIFLASLPAGTDLRYKYTLGDGLWNAERDPQGFFVTRQLIVPERELTVRDTVATWHGERGSITFQVSVPEDTPATDTIALQLNPFTWFEPLPMWRLNERDWIYILNGPLDFSNSIAYRYCRNLQCGSADDADTPGAAAVGRQATAAVVKQDLRDSVRAWRWWQPRGTSATVVAPEIVPRPGFEAGVEILPAFRPNWTSLFPQAAADITALGANSVILTPSWVFERNTPLPLLSFDPTAGPFEQDLSQMAQDAAERGLTVVLHPTLRASKGTVGDWWLSAPRDGAWWEVWFEEYRSFALTYARQAAAVGAAKLVLGGPEVAPALPGGSLPDGAPAGVPADAEQRWHSLLEEVRQRFPGTLAFEIEFGENLQDPPPFLDAVDEVHVYWHAPLAGEPGADVGAMQAAARTLIEETLLQQPALQGMPLVLSVEYLAISGGASGCPPAPDGSCRSPQDFDQGADPDPELGIDLEAQAAAYNAILLEAYAHPEIKGFYTRRYNPAVALRDKSASVRGKPARDVLWYWYPRLTGQAGE